MSNDKSSVFAMCKIDRATRKTASIPSIKNKSKTREARANGSVVVKIVKNQDEAYMDVWKPCDVKCAYNSGYCSYTGINNPFVRNP